MVDRNQSQRRRVRRGRPSGATAVEFAIVAPIIFLLFLGAIEMTRLNFLRHSAANAAYEAARNAIVPGGNEDEARQRALELLAAVKADRGVEFEFDEAPDQVAVTVKIPMNMNSWGITRYTSGFMITESCTLSRETIE